MLDIMAIILAIIGGFFSVFSGLTEGLYIFANFKKKCYKQCILYNGFYLKSALDLSLDDKEKSHESLNNN